MVIEERPINEESFTPSEEHIPVSQDEPAEAAAETMADPVSPTAEPFMANQTTAANTPNPPEGATIPGPAGMSAAEMDGIPDTYNEFYRESFAHVLQESIGYYVVCEFLVGVEIVRKSGILFAAGVNFLTLLDTRTEGYTICDFYSLKFATIYNRKTIPDSDNIDNTGIRAELYNPNNGTNNGYYYPGRNRNTGGYNRRW